MGVLDCGTHDQHRVIITATSNAAWNRDGHLPNKEMDAGIRLLYLPYYLLYPSSADAHSKWPCPCPCPRPRPSSSFFLMSAGFGKFLPVPRLSELRARTPLQTRGGAFTIISTPPFASIFRSQNAHPYSVPSAYCNPTHHLQLQRLHLITNANYQNGINGWKGTSALWVVSRAS